MGFVKAERTVVRGIKDLASIVSGWSSRRGLQDGVVVVVDKEAGNPGRLQVVEKTVANKTLEVVTRNWDALLQVRCPSIKNPKMEEERLQVPRCAVLCCAGSKRKKGAIVMYTLIIGVSRWMSFFWRVPECRGSNGFALNLVRQKKNGLAGTAQIRWYAAQAQRQRPQRLEGLPSSQGAAAQVPVLSVLSRPSTRGKKDLRTGCADCPALLDWVGG